MSQLPKLLEEVYSFSDVVFVAFIKGVNIEGDYTVSAKTTYSSREEVPK